MQAGFTTKEKDVHAPPENTHIKTDRERGDRERETLLKSKEREKRDERTGTGILERKRRKLWSSGEMGEEVEEEEEEVAAAVSPSSYCGGARRRAGCGRRGRCAGRGM